MKTVIVSISNVTNAFESGVQQLTYTISDDDTPPIVSLVASKLTIGEATEVRSLPLFFLNLLVVMLQLHLVCPVRR